MRQEEAAAGLSNLEGYAGFAERVSAACEGLRHFLGVACQQRKKVAAYGAAAKGNTLLNVAGITAKDIIYVADRSPHKQGRYLPGSHIPILPPEKIAEDKPDYLLILPWNIAQEVMEQMKAVRAWGCKFVTAIPTILVID